MATAASSPNPLLASTSPSDTSPAIQLHPLVILTISDVIARRTIRKQHTPIAGAILGQQNGREVTMEVAFDSKTVVGNDGQVQFDRVWFQDRLDMYKEVYKNPQLDLVGWWTIGASSGPEQRHLPAQIQVQTEHNIESAPLLLFHPDMVDESSGAAGKLPLTIYETVWTSANDSSSSMDVDGGECNQNLKYRELQYTVETGEAEMISVDFVARGGGNATAVDTTFATAHNGGSESSKRNGKGKKTETNGAPSEKSYLSPEEDELLTNLNAKANAIKMLQSRLNLLTAYLQSLPPSYLTDASLPLSTESASQLHQPTLRSISALLARLPLLTPPDTASFTQESERTASDVELISLLSSLTRTVQDAKELGKKWNVAEPRKGRNGSMMPTGGYAGMDGFEEEGGGGGGGGVGGIRGSAVQDLMMGYQTRILLGVTDEMANLDRPRHTRTASEKDKGEDLYVWDRLRREVDDLTGAESKDDEEERVA